MTNDKSFIEVTGFREDTGPGCCLGVLPRGAAMVPDTLFSVSGNFRFSVDKENSAEF